MKYIRPEYSRKKVNKAGKMLIQYKDTASPEREWALTVISNWRASHDYPVNTFKENLRKKILKRKFKGAIVVERLKRITSIELKLEINQSMNLSRMHDIGGLRAIVKNIEQVNALKDDFIASKFRHKIIGEYDYICSPKSSGYRSVHLVYQYYNYRVPEYDGLRLELQIRTKLQHAWATSVETMGTFLDSSLKSNRGPDKWLEFFSVCGAAFALLENSPMPSQFNKLSPSEITEKLISLEKEIDAVKNLETFGSAVRMLAKKRKSNCKYFLVILNIKEKTVIHEDYQADEYGKATEKYLSYEKEFGGQHEKQIVLVTVDSIQLLRRAYPNYFLDTKEFVRALDRYLEASGTIDM